MYKPSKTADDLIKEVSAKLEADGFHGPVLETVVTCTVKVMKNYMDDEIQRLKEK